MNPVKIFTDSTASLSQELLDRFSISVVPIYVVFDSVSYRDGEEMDETKLYAMVDEKGKLPTTSSATPHDFVERFKPWLDKGYDIVYVSISTKLSSCLQSANIAASEIGKDRVFIVDSFNLSSGIGLAAIQAAEYAAEGLSAKEVAEKTAAMTGRIRSSFVIDTLDYLYMGGRCSSLQKWASSVLKIHPRIIVTDGGMIVGEKFRGKWDMVLKGYLDTILLKKDKITPHRVFVTQTFSPKEDIDFLVNGLKEAIPELEEILVTDAGAVIASHCGKKTIGILYIEKAD
jgi:DegV family protein with EDD domain